MERAEKIARDEAAASIHRSRMREIMPVETAARTIQVAEYAIWVRPPMAKPKSTYCVYAPRATILASVEFRSCGLVSTRITHGMAKVDSGVPRSPSASVFAGAFRASRLRETFNESTEGTNVLPVAALIVTASPQRRAESQNANLIDLCQPKGEVWPLLVGVRS